MAQFIDQSVGFLREVREEFRKVSRPSWPELRNSTTVVIVAVLIMGLLVGLMDQIFARLVQLILK